MLLCLFKVNLSRTQGRVVLQPCHLVNLMLWREKVIHLSIQYICVGWTEQTETESPQKLRLQGYAGKLCCISLWNCSLQRADRQCAPAVALYTGCTKLKIAPVFIQTWVRHKSSEKQRHETWHERLRNTAEICSLQQSYHILVCNLDDLNSVFELIRPEIDCA